MEVDFLPQSCSVGNFAQDDMTIRHSRSNMMCGELIPNLCQILKSESSAECSSKFVFEDDSIETKY